MSDSHICGHYEYILHADGTAEITRYTGQGKRPLTIPAVLDGHPVTAIAAEAFYKIPVITNLTIPEGITTLAPGAFTFCTYKGSISLPASIKQIEQYPFHGLEGDIHFLVRPGSEAERWCRQRYAPHDRVDANGAVLPPLPYEETTRDSSDPSTPDPAEEDLLSDLFDLDADGPAERDTDVLFALDEALANAISSSDDVLQDAALPDTPFSMEGMASASAAAEDAFALLDEDDAQSDDRSADPEDAAEDEEDYFHRLLLEDELSLDLLGDDETATLHARDYSSHCCGDYEYALLRSGVYAITLYTGNDAEVTVPAELDGHPIGAITEYAFTDADALLHVTISEGIASIEDSAFASTPRLISVTLPDSLAAIGTAAFRACRSLRTVRFGSGLHDIGWAAFTGCEALTEVTLPAGLQSIQGSAFSGCTALQSVTLPENLRHIGACAFAACTSLKAIVLPEGLRDLDDYAFARCSSLQRVLLPDSLLQIHGSCFSQCSALTELIVSDAHPAMVSTGDALLARDGRTFLRYTGRSDSYCIPAGVTTIADHAFLDAVSLRSLMLPEGVTDVKEYAFSGCSNLQTLDLPESLRHVDNSAFEACASLTTLTLPDSAKAFYQHVLHLGTALTTIHIPDHSAVWAFADGALIDKVSKALVWCPCALTKTSFTVPDGITDIKANAFASCTGLERISLPDSLTSIGSRAFHGCTALKRIDMPAGVCFIGEEAFQGCTALESVAMPEKLFNLYERMFDGCSSLTHITMPRETYSLGSAAFRDCTSLESISLPGNLASIEESAFADCTALARISLPEDLREIHDHAFDGCTALEEVVLPEGLERIGSFAFSQCTSLKQLRLPHGLHSIDMFALGLQGCDPILTVTRGSYAEEWCEVFCSHSPIIIIDE